MPNIFFPYEKVKFRTSRTLLEKPKDDAVKETTYYNLSV